ncbi:hypothetical protein L0F63_000688, partial [Massospora cicadina]
MDDIGVALIYTAGITNLACIKPEAPYAPKLASFFYLSPQTTTYSPRPRLSGGSVGILPGLGESLVQ